MLRERACSQPRDRALVSRHALLQTAARCPSATDVALTAPHKSCPGARVMPPLSMPEHARHALLLHVDGNGFSGRLDELLTLGGAVLKQASPFEILIIITELLIIITVLKQASPFEAFYYPLLRPGVHYAPVPTQPSLLVPASAESAARHAAVLIWQVRANLSDVCATAAALGGSSFRSSGDGGGALSSTEELAANAERLARAYLSPTAVAEYTASLLRQYAELQHFTPRRHPNAVPWRGSAEEAAGTGAPMGRQGAAAAGAERGASSRAGQQSPRREVCAAGDARCCRRHPRACASRPVLLVE
jgi:hypothetical protein